VRRRGKTFQLLATECDKKGLQRECWEADLRGVVIDIKGMRVILWKWLGYCQKLFYEIQGFMSNGCMTLFLLEHCWEDITWLSWRA